MAKKTKMILRTRTKVPVLRPFTMTTSRTTMTEISKRLERRRRKMEKKRRKRTKVRYLTFETTNQLT